MKSVIRSPFGNLKISEENGCITAIDLTEEEECRSESCAVLDLACTELSEYFKGERTEFDLPLAPAGTKFQISVWEALRTIPYGQTRTYGQIAEMIGNANASRAVGMACHRNPIPIVIPCHRVVGSKSEGGYAYGLKMKNELLTLEKTCDNMNNLV